MSVNLADYYTDPTFMSDATPAINALLATERSIYVPDKPFKFDGTPQIVMNGQLLWGDGVFNNDMTARNGNLPLITIASGLNGAKVRGLHLKRSVPAVAGGSGIVTLGGQSNCEVSGNYIEDQWNGMGLLSGDVCKAFKNTVVRSYNHCISGSNTHFAWDWDIYENTLALATGDGIRFTANANAPNAPAVCPVGRMRDNDMFSLSGYGIAILANASVTVTNVQASGGFIGSTGRDGILLDTYEGYHNISGIKFEQIGIDATGREWTTPASGQGNAIALLGSNKDVSISDIDAFNIAYNAISNQAEDLNVGPSRFENTGLAGVAGQRCGVANFAGKAQLTGIRARNTNGGTSMQHGAWFADGAKGHINGSWGLGGTIAPYACAANAASLTVS